MLVVAVQQNGNVASSKDGEIMPVTRDPVKQTRQSNSVTELQSTGKCLPLLVDAATAAEMLSISPRKLWSLTNVGDVPCVRIGKSVRYSLEALRSWTQSKMTQSAVQE